jgi:TRAP-type C4-dicarboxylate transport system permease small subunit
LIGSARSYLINVPDPAMTSVNGGSSKGATHMWYDWIALPIIFVVASIFAVKHFINEARLKKECDKCNSCPMSEQCEGDTQKE